MDSQAAALKSAKEATYNRIARWMPFQTPLYFQSLLKMFDQLKAPEQLSLFKPNVDVEMSEVLLERKDSKPDSNANSEGSEAIVQQEGSNILNWPENRLRRKTSINDLVMNSETTAKPEDEEPKVKPKITFDSVGLVA